MKGFLKNIMDSFGWRTNRKLVVITSDDWGSIRVESKDIWNLLTEKGLTMDGSRFNRFDTLESNTDMEQLFDVLLRHRDQAGRHPVITAMTNVANPDFEKIKEGSFEKYFYETFVDTLQRYPDHDRVYKLYMDGIKQRVFVPEFHGREHVNVSRWMEALVSGDSKVKLGFESRFFTLDPEDLSHLGHSPRKGFGAAYDPDQLIDVDLHQEIISDGLKLFESVFGYKTIFFTAPSLLFHPALEKPLHNGEVKILDVPKYRKIPTGNNSYKKKFYSFGKKNELGQIYITRNAVFEPIIGESKDPVDRCINDIERAFKAKKPAIISNHRASFVGGLETENREYGLQVLDRLLTKIIQQFPTVEFITIRELYNIMQNNELN